MKFCIKTSANARYFLLISNLISPCHWFMYSFALVFVSAAREKNDLWYECCRHCMLDATRFRYFCPVDISTVSDSVEVVFRTG